jgi:hypothetical protein
MSKVLDYKPVTVNGPVNRNRARIIWRESDRTLAIFSKTQEYVVFEDVDEPVHNPHAQTYTTTVTLHDDHTQQVTWAQGGCSSCGFSLGRVSHTRLLREIDSYLAGTSTGVLEPVKNDPKTGSVQRARTRTR